jgi:hypothetical protein
MAYPLRFYGDTQQRRCAEMAMRSSAGAFMTMRSYDTAPRFCAVTQGAGTPCAVMPAHRLYHSVTQARQVNRLKCYNTGIVLTTKNAVID